MSIRKFFTLEKSKTSDERSSDLLENLLPSCSDEAKYVANKNVKDVIKKGIKCKRGNYCHYNEETRAEIGKNANLHRNASAARHFTKKLKLEKTMNESTVRSIKDAYRRQLTKTPEKFIEKLSKSDSCGRPKLLGKYDDDVIDYVQKLRDSGSVVNRQIVIAGARGILMSLYKYILDDFRGHVILDRPWAESFMRRIGFVRRKGTKAARKLPFDYEKQKLDFLSRVRDTREKFAILEEMVINFDQTNIIIIPWGNSTMAEQGRLY